MRTALFWLLLFGTAALPGAASPAPLLQAKEELCAKCKAPLKPGAKFCTGCGEKVVLPECAKCKKPMPVGAKFCVNCGQKVEDAPKPEEKKETPKPEEKKETPAPPKPEEKKETPAAPKPDTSKPEVRKEEPKGPVGQDVDSDKVKSTLDAELRKFGTSADEVNRAIDRGAAFLAAQYAKSDLSSDEDYLTAYALINTSQYQTNGKLRDRIHAFLRKDHWRKSGAAVYVAGLRALALEATRDPDLRALTRECAEYLVETQGPKGTWNYREDVAITPVDPVVKEVKEPGISVSGGEPLDEEVKGEEVPKKGICKRPSDGDNSCTQFAVLGLHAAAKCGFQVSREVWEKCLKDMEARHSKDGGWAYHSPSNSYGSMTCAGICTVALCRFYLGEKNYLESENLQAGLAWLGKNFSVNENPKANGQWPLYYIYSVERVGVFAATESIGEHRWYPMGAKYLVGQQKPDGSWQTNFEDQKRGTSFALLFLTRATAPVKAIKRGGPGWLETHLVNDSTNIMFILDASGSMRDEMDGKEKFQIVKEVVESIVRKLPEGSLVGLRVYGHRKTALDEQPELDSELLIPIGPLNPETFIARVKALRCKGMTPLTYSLTETIKDVSKANPEAEVVTILLTDGGESTRGARPYEAAAKLAASRKGMKVHVVGFDITEDDWKEQLEKTAAAGNGKYFHARKAADLLNALALATTGAAEYTLLDKDKKELFKGKVGDRHQLKEGKYIFSLSLDGKAEEKTLWINTEVTSHVTVALSKFLKK